MSIHRFLNIYLPTGLGIGGIIAILILGFTYGATDPDELVSIDVQIDKFYFNKSKQKELLYDFTAVNFNNDFRVPVSFTKLLDIQRLVSELEKNREFQVWIKESDVSQLDSKSRIMTYSICSKNTCFLNIGDLTRDSKRFRYILAPLMTILMIIITIFIYKTRQQKFG